MNHRAMESTLAKGIRMFLVAMLLGAVLTFATPPPVAHAYILEVDTDADNPALKACTEAANDCSLRGAIDRDYEHAGLDIITFAAATNGHSITLGGEKSDDDNDSGDLDIQDGGNLTIQATVWRIRSSTAVG